MNEIWRAVIGHEGLYEVSSHGRVRGLDRLVIPRHCKNPKRIAGVILQQRLDKDGYPRVNLRDLGNVRIAKVHTLMAEAFLGPRPSPKHEVCHNDRLATGNLLSNIRWGTCQENHNDTVRHGMTTAGTRNTQARLTETQVQSMRNARVAEGVSYGALGVRFGVSRQQAWKICRNESWKV